MYWYWWNQHTVLKMLIICFKNVYIYKHLYIYNIYKYIYVSGNPTFLICTFSQRIGFWSNIERLILILLIDIWELLLSPYILLYVHLYCMFVSMLQYLTCMISFNPHHSLARYYHPYLLVVETKFEQV